MDFRLFDAPGWIDVGVEPNTEPEALGCPPYAKDFPVCTATVTCAGRGYTKRLLVGCKSSAPVTARVGAGSSRSTRSNRSVSPLTRFVFFGFAPVFFDAPGRRSRHDMDWTAESFLCFVPMLARRRVTRAILGFSWGFGIRDETVRPRAPTTLPPNEWNKHLGLLRREHPSFAFATGYRNS
jgi:hypothetical protein